MLAIGRKSKKKWGCKIILDAHEFYMGLHEEDLKWHILFKTFTDYMCKTTLPHADLVITVSHLLCQWYEKYYQCSPLLIINAPFYEDIPVRHSESSTIQLIHHGHPVQNRRPDLLIEAMDYADPHFELTFMFKNKPSTEAYYAELKAQAASNPRIHFRDAVPMEKLAQVVNHYDAGIHLIPPVNRNNEGMLPNKLFEFIQGRLGVVFSPGKEVERVIQQYKLGFISKDFSAKAMGEAINRLNKENLHQFKQNADKASRVLCADQVGIAFIEAIQSL